ncbi:hypothetical protein KC19_10G048500 [Ceratodon purpureus]|uniref:Uncharacterized protein n=1 Tax=Ceratodon purpureus TaxID=3225 RepID=A0A8T0GKK3_CERPU|nr:hypothetical protein KC19_10G048500 [Ceratodon purpureus]
MNSGTSSQFTTSRSHYSPVRRLSFCHNNVSPPTIIPNFLKIFLIPIMPKRSKLEHVSFSMFSLKHVLGSRFFSSHLSGSFTVFILSFYIEDLTYKYHYQ